MNKNTMIALAGVLLAVIGCFMPWEKLGELSLSAMDDIGGTKPGMVVIIMAVLCGALTFFNKKWSHIVSAVVAALLLVLLFMRMGNIKKEEEVTVGMGLYLSMAGSVLIIVANAMGMMGNKKPAA